MDGAAGGRAIAWRSGGRPLAAYVELTLAMVTIGSSAVVGKRMVEDLPVFIGAALRFGLAALVLVPLLARRAGGWPRIGRRDLGAIGLQTLVGVVGFTVFWLYGLEQTTAAEGGMVASTTPAVIALASFLVLGERLRARQTAGIGLAVGGVVLMTVVGGAAGGGPRGPNPLFGNALIFGAVVGEALPFALGQRAGARFEPLAIATLMTLIGFALFLPVAVVEAVATDLSGVSNGAWLAVVYYALGPTVLGYVLAFRGLAKVPANTVAVFTGVVPVSAVLLAGLVLGETIGWVHLGGVACVLAAIALAVAAHGR